MPAEHPSVIPLLERIGDETPEGYVPPSPAALRALDAALDIAGVQAPVYLGSFAQYADDDE